MVAVAVGELERRKITVTLQSGEKLTMSLKNFVLRNVAEELKNVAPDEEVANAVEHYDEVVMPLESISAVGQISGGHRRKTRRSRK